MLLRTLSFSMVLCAALMQSPATAAVVFSQDFSSSAVVGDYVSATPNSGQVNDISADNTLSTVAIVGNELTFNMASGGVAGMLRSTDLSSPVMAVMDLELVFTYSTVSTGSFGPGPNLQIQ